MGKETENHGFPASVVRKGVVDGYSAPGNRLRGQDELPHAMILEHSRFATEADRTELVSVDRKVEE
jgi:hypothetical protein